jgi:hypothetical protein
MNFVEDLDVQLNDNSLEVILGLSGSPCLQATHPGPLPAMLEDKPNCVTHCGMWDEDLNDQQQDSAKPPDSPTIHQMKSARTDQETKVRNFIATLRPPPLSDLKASCESVTEVGSPKKKKIRKMAHFKLP